ncbi:type II secretion system protein [bacterium]|nr:type II secretion system protein [bacterium]
MSSNVLITNPNTKRHGFSLVEIVISLLILEILFIGFINYLGVKRTALDNDLERLVLVHQTEVLMEKYALGEKMDEEFERISGKIEMQFFIETLKTERGIRTVIIEGGIKGGRTRYNLRREIFEKSSYLD